MSENVYSVFFRIMHAIDDLDFMFKVNGGWVGGNYTSWEIVNTDIVLILSIRESWPNKNYYLAWEWKVADRKIVLSFDEILAKVPTDIQTKLLFNLDLFH